MTMNAEMREQLSAYVDGELSKARRRRLEEALERDADLRRELDALRATRGLLGSLPQLRAPDDFVQRVIARAERACLMTVDKHAPAEHRGGWLRWGTTAAVLLLAASVGVVLMGGLLRTPPQAPSPAVADGVTPGEALVGQEPDDPPPPAPSRHAGLGAAAGVASADPVESDAVDGDEDVIAAGNLIVRAANADLAERDLHAVLASNGFAVVADPNGAPQTDELYLGNFAQAVETRRSDRKDYLLFYDEGVQERQILQWVDQVRSRQAVCQLPMSNQVVEVRSRAVRHGDRTIRRVEAIESLDLPRLTRRLGDGQYAASRDHEGVVGDEYIDDRTLRDVPTFSRLARSGESADYGRIGAMIRESLKQMRSADGNAATSSEPALDPGARMQRRFEEALVPFREADANGASYRGDKFAWDEKSAPRPCEPGRFMVITIIEAAADAGREAPEANAIERR
jgi:anti-sigma factor RsiW